MPSVKIDRYEYLTAEEILPSDKKRVIEQATFTHSPLIEKQAKTIGNQGKKQVKAIEDHGKQLVESHKLIKNNFNIDRHFLNLEI